MAEIQIKVEIQDSDGSVRKRVTLAVSEDISKMDLIKGLKIHFSDLLKSEKVDVFIDPPEDGPLFGKLISEGSRVIVRPRQSSSMMRVVKEE